MKNVLSSLFRLCPVAVALLACGLIARAQDTAVYTTLHRFTGNDGSSPGNLVEGDDGNFYGTDAYGGFGYVADDAGTGNGTMFRVSPAGVLTTIHAFADASEGQHPYGLIKGRDGNFYGLTSSDSSDHATVFRITPEGQLTTIYSSTFGALNGYLLQGDDGNFYGVSFGGGGDYGSIFRLTPAGVYTTLHTFAGDADGAANSGLTRGSDGNFYGTGNLGVSYSGTIYRVTPAGVFTTIYTFTGDAGDTDGFLPNGLTLGRDGNLYGTTQGGGANNLGVVFRVTNDGQFTVLHNFTGGADSGVPIGNLTLGLDGNFYGVAAGDTLPQAMPFRGAAQPEFIGIDPPIYPVPPVVTMPSKVFRVTPAGVLTPLYASETTLGEFIQGKDGNFYGTDYHYTDYQSSVFKLTVVSHPAFFAGQVPLVNGVEYLAFPNGNTFGYYAFLDDPRYLYHFDLGYEFVFDAADGKSGVYLYDFKSGSFFYTSPTFPFPYMYDFSLNAVLYYYPDPNNAGRYNTNGVRYFYNFSTGQIISK